MGRFNYTNDVVQFQVCNGSSLTSGTRFQISENTYIRLVVTPITFVGLSIKISIAQERT